MSTTSDALKLETHRMPWWLGALGGVFNIIIGILLLTVPVRTVLVLVLTLGYYWIFSGMVTLVYMFIDRHAWGWKLLSGVLSIIAGIYVLRFPLIGAVSIPAIAILFLGIQGLVTGAVSLVLAFKGGGWGAGIMGVLGLIFGFVMITNYANPSMIVSLVWIVAIFTLVGGVSQLIQSIAQRK